MAKKLIARKLKWYEKLGLGLTIAGAINWGIVGIFGLDLVASIIGVGTWATVTYIAIGVGGIYSGYQIIK